MNACKRRHVSSAVSAFLSAMLWTAPAMAETIATVAAIPSGLPGNPAGSARPARILPGILVEQEFDGSLLTRVVFRDERRRFEYSPPSGWKIKCGQRTELVTGPFKASIALALVNDASTVAAPKKSSAQTEVEDFQVLGQPIEHQVSTFARDGITFLRLVARTLGPEWQINFILEGPEKNFAAAQEQLLGTLTSLSVQTEAELQKVKEEKGKQALAQIASRPAPKLPPTGRVRGRLD